MPYRTFEIGGNKCPGCGTKNPNRCLGCGRCLVCATKVREAEPGEDFCLDCLPRAKP